MLCSFEFGCNRGVRGPGWARAPRPAGGDGVGGGGGYPAGGGCPAGRQAAQRFVAGEVTAGLAVLAVTVFVAVIASVVAAT